MAKKTVKNSAKSKRRDSSMQVSEFDAFKGYGLAIGLGLGLLVGMLLDNMTWGIVVGTAVGVGVGAIIDRRNKQRAAEHKQKWRKKRK